MPHVVLLQVYIVVVGVLQVHAVLGTYVIVTQTHQPLMVPILLLENFVLLDTTVWKVTLVDD